MNEHVHIGQIRAGDRFWECESGENREFIADGDAVQAGDEITFMATDQADQSQVRYMANVTAMGYAPKLYKRPQYAYPRDIAKERARR